MDAPAIGTLAVFDKYTQLANPLVRWNGRDWVPVTLDDLRASGEAAALPPASTRQTRPESSQHKTLAAPDGDKESAASGAPDGKEKP